MSYISWCYPHALIPPRETICSEKYEYFLKEFTGNGWGTNHPAVIGYWIEPCKVQLINGAHRYYAARAINLLIPTVIYEKDYIESIWGTDEWIRLVNCPSMLY